MNRETVKQALNKKTPTNLSEMFGHMKSMAKEENMRIGDVMIPLIPVPLFVNSQSADSLEKKLNLLTELLVRVELYALSSEGKGVFERLYSSLCSGGKHLVDSSDFESEFSLRRRHKRIDAFFDEESGDVKVIEVNQAAPLATHFYDGSQRIAGWMLKELNFEYKPRLTAPHILKWFFDEYEERFGTGKRPETIALVIEHGYAPKFTDLPGVAADCEKISDTIYDHKLKIITCFPYQVTLKNGTAFVENTKIDMFWRNSVYMTSYREQKLPIMDYEKILSNGKDFLIVNSAKSWLTRTKELFSLFSDDILYDKLNFSESEKTVLKDIIPLTVNISRNPEYISEIADNRIEWVSKPTDSGFGKGVVFGKSFSAEEWIKLMEERNRDGFVFQKKIKPSSGLFTVFDAEGKLSEVFLEYDYCPHHINGSFHGTALVRALKSDKSSDEQFAAMNLAGGGFLFPLVCI